MTRKAFLPTIQLLLLLSIILSALPCNSQGQVVDDKWALVVGISRFKDSKLNLRFPSKDARDFADYLVKSAHFAPDHVKLITDEEATRTRILTEIADKWLPRVAHPNDLVVIYISSHGSPSQLDNEGLNYLVAHDTDKEQLFATGLSIQNLAEMVRDRVHTERAVIILDACHSGSAHAGSEGKSLVRIGNFDIGQIPIGKGLMVICSSKPNEISWESRNYENGVFTRKLIESLQQKGEYTRLSEAFQYLQDQVQNEVLRDRGQMQTPVLRSAWKGDDLVIATRPVKPRPGLPDTVATMSSATQATQEVAISSGATALSITPQRSATSSATLKLTPRVAILPITGPGRLDLSPDWKGFADKDHLDVPKRLTEIGLIPTMESALQHELVKELKRNDVFVVQLEGGSLDGDSGAAAKALLRNSQVVDWPAIGRLVQAKYLLEMKISDLEIKDEMNGDTVGLRITAQLINGETGESLWLLKSRKFSRLTMARHDDSIFAEIRNFFPSRIAKDLSKDIARSVKEQ